MNETEDLRAEIDRLRKVEELADQAIKAEADAVRQAEAEVERLTVLTDLDANRIQEIEARALDYYSRAEVAEAEVERLTHECLDREATETDARERLRQAEERLAAVKAKAELAMCKYSREAGWKALTDIHEIARD